MSISSNHHADVGKRSAFFASATVAVLLFASLGCFGGGAADVEIGQRTPSFRLASLDGSKFSSSSLEGSTVIINFWATWCQPCLKEIPVLQELEEKAKVKVVGIALDEDGERAVRPFVERKGIDYTILLGNQDVFQRFDGFGIPYTLVLDEASQIVNIYRGPITREDLEGDLERIAAASSSST